MMKKEKELLVALWQGYSRQLAISSSPYLNMFFTFLPCFRINKCLCIPVKYAHVNYCKQPFNSIQSIQVSQMSVFNIIESTILHGSKACLNRIGNIRLIRMRT